MGLMNYSGPLESPVNLGNPEEMRIVDLAEKIIKETGSKSKINFEPLPQDDPIRRKPDVDLASTILGWFPTA